MLIIRNDNFVIQNNEVYIIGSASNELYANNIFQMGNIEILGWTIDSPNVNGLEKLILNPKMKLYLYDNKLSFYQKCKIIKKHVIKANTIS